MSQRPKSDFFQFIKTLLFFFGIAFLLRASVVEAFKIPSGSMEPTLLIGDHILVSKLRYGLHLPFLKEAVWEFSSPQRGDVVVFTQADDSNTKEDESDTNIIKRVIALPGERVEVRGPAVFINGILLKEETARWVHGGTSRDFPLTTVPEGTVFLLGDNRDESKDARFWSNPFLPVSRIKGRAFLIYYNSQSNYKALKRMFSIIH